jgi:hypothetical protein
MQKFLSCISGETVRTVPAVFELVMRYQFLVAECIESLKPRWGYFERLVSALLRKLMGQSKEQGCI